MKKEKVVVAYIITKLELGGAQKICLALKQGLEEHNHKPFLISGNEGPLVKAVEGKSSIILLNNFKREVSVFNFLQELKAFVQLVSLLKKLRKQYPNIIVHTHSTKAGLMGRWAAFCARVKCRIHTVHGYGFHSHQNKFAWFITYTLEFITSFITSHYICVSSADIKTGIKLFPQFSKKHTIIRAAVDHDQFFIPARQTTLQPDQKFIFGTISCFKKQKNLFDLFRAFELAYQQNAHIRLEVIGEGALRPQLEQWIKEHQLEQHIILHGWQNKVKPIMLTWHAFVLSSLWEGLPCAVIEARLLKLPVLSYNTGGVHDVIISGKNGFLYPQKDVHALGYGMFELSINRKLYNKLSSHQEDLSDFKQETMIKQHLTLYKNL